MGPPQIAARRAAPRSAERLDRDRQAAPQVFERLRGMIISLALPPGSPLSRAALAGQFGVSSTPIRDALMRLEEEGLVDVFPQYATVVSRVDVRLAQQAHFLRQAVELEIVRALAASHDETFVADLNAAIAQQQQFAKAGEFEKFMAADNEFHARLYA
ncbi:MAG: GntR family transcriptional regulator, partial [Bradyrhizobium sp.]